MEGESIKGETSKPSTPLPQKSNNSFPTELTQAGESSSSSTFTREIDDYFCDFTLTKEGKLKILLTSQLDASVSSVELSKQEKKVHEQLNFFQSLQEVFEYLQENSVGTVENGGKKLVRIDEQGRIVITVVSILGKKERVKEIFLEPQGINENKQLYLENAIKKISKSMMILRKEIQILKDKQTSFESSSAELMQKMASEGSKLEFIPDKTDPHFQKFLKKEKRITKIHDNNTYFNLVSEVPITKTGISYFHIKINETAQKNVIIGVGSKFVRGIQNAYTHPDFIGFYLYGDGYVWEKTNQRDLNLHSYPLQNGVVITTVVDMDLGFICWEVCRVKVAYAVLPLQLKAKLLFPVVMMINVNDAISLV